LHVIDIVAGAEFGELIGPAIDYGANVRRLAASIDPCKSNSKNNAMTVGSGRRWLK